VTSKPGYAADMSARTAGKPDGLRWRDDALLDTAAAGDGFFFDFDGTLAEIRDDPEQVQPVPGVTERLARLAVLAGRLGVVSARPVEFLRSRFPSVPGMRLFGLYGLESAVGSEPVQAHPSAAGYADVIADVAARARRELPAEVGVEDKRLTVALHYRRAPELGAQVLDWATGQRQRHGLRVQSGRMVVELKPPGTRDKGTVIAEQAADLPGAWYFGDDLGDVAAFDTLTRLRRERPGFAGVRVVVGNPETGAGLDDYADVLVPTPDLVPVLLDQVLARLATTPR
jgi:trehalose 6-phosphate phosphatase